MAIAELNAISKLIVLLTVLTAPAPIAVSTFTTVPSKPDTLVPLKSINLTLSTICVFSTFSTVILNLLPTPASAPVTCLVKLAALLGIVAVT